MFALHTNFVDAPEIFRVQHLSMFALGCLPFRAHVYILYILHLHATIVSLLVRILMHDYACPKVSRTCFSLVMAETFGTVARIDRFSKEHRGF